MMNTKLKNLKFSLLIFLLFFTFPFETKAEKITVTPILIDQETSARDLIKKDITIRNTENRPVRVYASVHELDKDDFGKILEFVDPSSPSVDRATSISSWLEISRARITIPAKSEITIPLTIRISPNAKPGEYRAFVGFATAANYAEADRKVINGEGVGVTVRLNLGQKTTPVLKLLNFNAKQLITGENSQGFKITLENQNDSVINPQGEVIIYNGKGIEQTSIPVSNYIKTLEAGQIKDIFIPVPELNSIGKNKAFLNIEYGDTQKALVYDTDFFFYIPWYYLLFMIILLVILPISLTLILRNLSKQTTITDTSDDVPMFIKKTEDYTVQNEDINLKQ